MPTGTFYGKAVKFEKGLRKKCGKFGKGILCKSQGYTFHNISILENIDFTRRKSAIKCRKRAF